MIEQGCEYIYLGIKVVCSSVRRGKSCNTTTIDLVDVNGNFRQVEYWTSDADDLVKNGAMKKIDYNHSFCVKSATEELTRLQKHLAEMESSPALSELEKYRTGFIGSLITERVGELLRKNK